MTAEEREQGTIAYVALGSNIDDREHYLQDAITALNQESGITVTGLSSIYETEPVGYVDQSAFLNMVIQIITVLPAEELLFTMLAIEKRLGRTRDLRWGPRTIDLDLLLYGDHQLTTPDLIIPHPRMHERAFVLVPLTEVLYKRQDAAFEFISAHLEKLEGKEGVILWKKAQ
ncbi:2-amino-4-hydroxy-6-hydroxymethyldihydropteridine diphosphokinase [Paenibacillus sp. V4I3]|jgi:2-amino-4-hydroxy-6-hydroxymethyldihydropteridine diphosphokinase|uniref:2-amino-4-hydroxy-6- hydroxymethyldihydropteridine diphosphokinase n=1 Tax=unclassified Paenibacillus TaxID=185978 RepID=UPI002788137E|nr:MULTISPECIES: 2-amino-4-hydroxy-6-hydroxymethyldihydropteridine diphosphokinase [unclassified Paenibacillus]MDF2645172.1 folK [Paenibacillus sp.]MDQ0872019.1 2-amino-4-hydroxy-6-hydroxymethyldihydropteridine diphosphokinase [Paenibacillus sp. V4I3]MDQ0892089.1 2-amino-4-hydroxy-6-hydroxymethyldihydropteridine diphosphokinase [Paenibacillus sp. V4I9]MDQ0902822.1 2-amino-4-hydroxy-6-hydroxymethyldihydropteridine diphosphokinase [Paenibacillus sp. V4I7]MDQ0918699.1 2-amino-4-hydroxy-6-hydroxym